MTRRTPRLCWIDPTGVREKILDGKPYELGRKDDCDIVLPSDRCSRHHARVLLAPDGTALVTDFETTHRPFVNEKCFSIFTHAL